MKQILFLLLITLCSCHSTTSKKGQENEADSSLLQEELYPDSIFKFKPIPTKEEQEQPSETTSFVLQPVPRDIPTGEAVSPTSLNPEKPDVPLNKNDAFQKVQKRRVQEKR